MSEQIPVRQNSSAVTPERILQFAWAYAPPLIIDAAVRTRLFDILASGPKSLEQIAAEAAASARGVHALMDTLVALELAARDGENRYRLTQESDAFLVSSRSGYLGSLFGHMTDDLIPKWLSLRHCVQTGEPVQSVNGNKQGAEFFSGFVEALFPLNYPAANALAQNLPFSRSASIRVLDLAAGSGVWGIALTEAYPQARVSAADWEPVLSVTKRVVARHNLSDRFDFIAGDIQQADFGSGYDLAILGHILHSEGEERSRSLLHKVANALKPGGVVAIGEFLVNDDRTGPLSGLIFSVNMLINTDHGRAFSFSELSHWLYQAGFKNARTLDAPGPSPLVLADC